MRAALKSEVKLTGGDGDEAGGVVARLGHDGGDAALPPDAAHPVELSGAADAISLSVDAQGAAQRREWGVGIPVLSRYACSTGTKDSATGGARVKAFRKQRM